MTEDTVSVPLHAIAHGRAGDKGNRSNISIVAYNEDAYPFIASQVTKERVLELFEHKGASDVARYDLPNLRALNFVINDALEGGVNGALCQDLHGKTLSFLLLGEIMVDVPKSVIPKGSTYLD
jgi:hypothetical protein